MFLMRQLVNEEPAMADWRLCLDRIPAFVLALMLSAGTAAGVLWLAVQTAPQILINITAFTMMSGFKRFGNRSA